MRISNPPPFGPPSIYVRKVEEKQSDVNLATYLLLDCFRNDCDEAVIISNDSDLATPIQVVRDEFNMRIGVINPQHRKFRSALLRNARILDLPGHQPTAFQKLPTPANHHRRRPELSPSRRDGDSPPPYAPDSSAASTSYHPAKSSAEYRALAGLGWALRTPPNPR